MQVRQFNRCPRCKSPMEPAISMAGSPSEFWWECTNCNTFINTYVPQEHQRAVHTDTHTFIGNFGGYGTGKTLTSREELIKHVLITPNGNTLIGANVSSQYEQTIKREFESDIPASFVAGYSTQKQYIDLINGHRVMFRPLDDPDKLRSYNLTMFIIIEASETKYESLTQLKTRLRNRAATIPLVDDQGNIVYQNVKGSLIPEIGVDWRKGIIESNPDAGWIRHSILLVSDEIHKHGRITDSYVIDPEQQDPVISSHVCSTDVNAYLPKDFIHQISKNKPAWWVNRYVYSSFSYSEGMVYPNALKTVIPHFDIPPHWKRIVAHDYGLVDPSVFVFAAIDEKEGKVYVYKDPRTSDRNVRELANFFKEHSADVPAGGYYRTPIIDPKSGPKRDYDKKTLIEHYAEYGVLFEPGHVQIDARIFRLNTYMECGNLFIFDTCKDLIYELSEYKFKPRTLEATTAANEQPEDKNNHGINALEWIVMALPADPRNLTYGAYDRLGRDLRKLDQRAEEDLEADYWALSTTPSNPYEAEREYTNYTDYM